MVFEELTQAIRVLMVSEFQAEQSSSICAAYRPKVLTLAGENIFCSTMEEHLASGDESSLAIALSPSAYWVERGIRNTKKGPISYTLSGHQRAKVFAITDFNTWYVRALCKQLMNEGVETCEVYRAQYAYEPRGACLLLEGKLINVKALYEGHRSRYHPALTSNPSALSVPAGPNCHHSVRRAKFRGGNSLQ